MALRIARLTGNPTGYLAPTLRLERSSGRAYRRPMATLRGHP